MHIKYKATSWDDIIGNSIIKKSIQNLNLGGRAILLEGEKGCGKSVMARIIAKDFGASEHSIRMINSVQTSKVEEMRETLDILLTPSIFKEDKKVLIIDEPQELSHKAQEALLIPLENLPINILVITCSALSEKIEEMLLERFTRFRVRPLSNEESNTLICTIVKKEDIKLPKLIKQLLIEKSDGNPRRILINLTKLKDVKSEEEAKYLLDLSAFEESSEILELFRLLISNVSWNIIRKKLNELFKTENPEGVRVGLLNLTSGRLMSDFFNDVNEGKKLILMYKYLLEANNFPEKANLIIAIYKMVGG